MAEYGGLLPPLLPLFASCVLLYIVVFQRVVLFLSVIACACAWYASLMGGEWACVDGRVRVRYPMLLYRIENLMSAILWMWRNSTSLGA